MSFREEGGEAIEEQIGCLERTGWPRSRCGGTAYLDQAAGGREATGEQRSSPRVEVRLARKIGVEPLKALGSFQEQRGCSSAHARRERDLTPEQLRMRRLQLVWRRGLHRRQKLERALEHSGIQARLGGGKCTPHPLLGIGGENDGAMQERG